MTTALEPPTSKPRSEGALGSLWRRPRLWVQPTLDLYMLRRFLWLYTANLICFTLVYILVDALQTVDSLSEQAGSLFELIFLSARYYIAVVPAVFCQLLGPIVALTSGLFAVTLFHRANELVPMLATGRPFWRIVLPILLAGLAISGLTFVVQEQWIPRTAGTIKEVLGLKEGVKVMNDQIYHDFERGILIMMKQYSVVDQVAEGVTVIHIPGHVRSRSGEREYYIWARSMEWVKPERSKGYWLLRNGQVQEYDPTRKEGTNLVPPRDPGLPGAPRLLYETFIDRPLDTTLIPGDMEAQKEDVVYLRLDELRRKVETSLDHRWAVKYYSRFAAPAAAFVLLLVGLPLIAYYGPRNIFIGALLSALVGASYIVVGSITTHLAIRGFLSSPLGAWLGPLVFASAGITWLRFLRA